MRTELQQALAQAFAEGRQALECNDLGAAYAWLERAGWQARDWREVAGQLPRLAALLFSRIWVPLGNTGRARVSAFRPMPLSEELKRLLG